MKIIPILRIENHFNMPFSDVINRLHIKEEKSLNDLSKACGVSRQTITNMAKKLGLKIRTVKQATALTKNKGANHFAYGKPNKLQSEKMKANNPMYNNNAAIRRAVTISETFKKRLSPQEKAFKRILTNLCVKFEMQRPCGRYNLDFFIPEMNLAIEIDSTDKWGICRRQAAARRDAVILREQGIVTLRINKKFLADETYILNILRANNIIG